MVSVLAEKYSESLVYNRVSDSVNRLLWKQSTRSTQTPDVTLAGRQPEPFILKRSALSKPIC